MTKGYWVIAALAVGSMVLLLVFVQRSRIREGLFAFVAAQSISWPGTIGFAYMGAIESPVRLFPKATDSNFIISYIFLPAVFVVYYLHYPKHKSRIIQIAFTLMVTGAASLMHVAIQKYTDLLVYITFSGYRGWFSTLIIYYVLRRYTDWFFARLSKIKVGEAK